MLYIVVQKDEAYTFRFNTREEFMNFCQEYKILNKHDLMVLETNGVYGVVIWKQGIGWLDDPEVL